MKYSSEMAVEYLAFDYSALMSPPLEVAVE
jgi:hypothetical protein